MQTGHCGNQRKRQREETIVELISKIAAPSRRTVLKGMGAGLAASALGAPMIARAQSKGTIKIGFITPMRMI